VAVKCLAARTFRADADGLRQMHAWRSSSVVNAGRNCPRVSTNDDVTMLRSLDSMQMSNESALWAYAPTVGQAPRCSYGSQGLLFFVPRLVPSLKKIHLRLHDLEELVGAVCVSDGSAERG
jgi:hypothetical protein